MFGRRAVQGIFILTFLVLAACQPLTGRGAPETLSQNEVIALLDLTASDTALNAAAARAGYQRRETQRLAALGQRMVRFDLPQGVTGAQAIAYLEAAEPAATVGVNHVYRLQSGTGAVDPRNVPQTLTNWPTKGCRARMPVGLIDAAVDSAQPHLSGVRVVARHFGTGAPAPVVHGTDVAGVLADPARLRGVTLYNASVMERDGSGAPVAGADAVIRALDWLGEQNVRLVNLSIAGPENKLLARAVDAASARGMILVAAAGNAGPSAPPQFPAAFDAVIAVTAVDASGAPYRKATRGAYVDLAAPGVDVFVQTGKGRFVTGTSVAAPFVTALIAGDRRLSGQRSAKGVRSILSGSARDLGPQGRDDTFGFGLVNAEGRCN